ncbi:hypothetical protein [Agrobacterium vitis]|uniref:hypothetical protein n=1 Tax=Agrobacterium vitis TaxID=373 RepID=UPI0018D26AE6|nr:hypothetical protein [Agrobacterium vitis]
MATTAIMHQTCTAIRHVIFPARIRFPLIVPVLSDRHFFISSKGEIAIFQDQCLATALRRVAAGLSLC